MNGRKLRIGYFADGPWAHEAFEKLIRDDSLEIVFICIRYSKKDPVLQELGILNKIEVLWTPNVNSENFIEIIQKYAADIFVSMSFDQIFKDEIINLPLCKTINCHAGKLPFYRGRNILNWVLINDEKEFGITVHYVDDGIDTGDIILQETYQITDDDTYETLLHRAHQDCADVLYRAVKMVQEGKVCPIKQYSIHPIGMYCGMRKEGDELIDWNQNSREIFNFVRAVCSPGPRATSYVDRQPLKINRVRQIENALSYKGIPGQVIGRSSQGIYVKTKDTMVEILEYDFLRKLRVGDRLTGEG